MSRDRVAALAEDAARTWGLAPPELVRHGMTSAYACGDVVVRITRSGPGARRSLALAHYLLDHGVPVAAPAVDDVLVEGGEVAGGLSATAWERVRPVPGMPVDWGAVGQVVRVVHRLDPDEVAAVHPLARLDGLAWWDFAAVLDDVDDLLDPGERRALRQAVGRSQGWRDRFRSAGVVVCHGDVHPGNVLMRSSGPVLLDWDLIGSGPPGWDHAALLTWEDRWGGDPGLYAAFASGYGADLSRDPLTAELAHLRLLAATLMRVRAGRHDPAAALEARQRLRWWRGDPTAPVWRPM